MWYEGRPPGQQPRATNCNEAERIASRSNNARVIYGSDVYGRNDRWGDRNDDRWGRDDRYGDRRDARQGFDQGYLVEALRALGPSYVGVTQIPADATDQQVLDLHETGVRAVRVNVARGGSASLDVLDRLACRVHDVAGWHTELYIDSRTVHDELGERIAALPAVSIDHLGMHADGLPALLRLVERGVKVKATGFVK